MLFEFLLDHRIALVVLVFAVAIANIGLVPVAAKHYKQQPFVTTDDWNPPIAGRKRGPVERVLLSLFWTFVVCLASFGFDRAGVEFVLGGYFILQLTSLVLSIAALLTIRALKDPASASGQIRYTAVYRYRAFAADLLGACLVELIAYALSGRLIFAGAALFSAAMAAGCYRRAHQARAAMQAA